MDNQQHRDEILWQAAKRRVAFKGSLGAYTVVNLGLIAIWYATSGPGTYFWPIWPMIGWGLGVTIQYIGAYHSHQLFSVENEYEKLKKERNNNEHSI